MCKTSGVGQSAELLGELVQEFERLKIEYCVIGALAGALHGVVRASIDADVAIFLDQREFTPESFSRTLKLQDAHITHQAGDRFDPITSLVQVSDKFNNRVDVLIGVREIPHSCMTRIISADFFGQKLSFIGLEDYLISKLSAGSELDLLDVSEALKLNWNSLDLNLLMTLASSLSNEKLEQLKHALDMAAVYMAAKVA
jgi:hypothetical protein